MIIVEYKDKQEQTWSPMHFPPTYDWEQLKTLAEKWDCCIRLYNPTTDLVEREFYPA